MAVYILWGGTDIYGITYLSLIMCNMLLCSQHDFCLLCITIFPISVLYFRYYYNKKSKQSSWQKPVELMTLIEVGQILHVLFALLLLLQWWQCLYLINIIFPVFKIVWLLSLSIRCSNKFSVYFDIRPPNLLCLLLDPQIFISWN